METMNKLGVNLSGLNFNNMDSMEVTKKLKIILKSNEGAEGSGSSISEDGSAMLDALVTM